MFLFASKAMFFVKKCVTTTTGIGWMFGWCCKKRIMELCVYWFGWNIFTQKGNDFFCERISIPLSLQYDCFFVWQGNKTLLWVRNKKEGNLYDFEGMQSDTQTYVCLLKNVCMLPIHTLRHDVVKVVHSWFFMPWNDFTMSSYRP